MGDNAEAKSVTRLLDKVGRNDVIRIIITTRLVTKDNEADNWRCLTQCTDRILVSHAFKSFTANLHITRISTTRVSATRACRLVSD